MAFAGVDRLMVDLEINGKDQRQKNLNTVISRHTFQDITIVRHSLINCDQCELMVRVNPLYSNSKPEINEVISRGADRIMLPMFTHPDEISRCLDFIGGRVPLTLLLETSAGFARLSRILSLGGFDDIHIGLNDLHIDMGLDFMFELFSSGLLDHACAMISEHNIPFGIGGVSALGTGDLPAELILAAHLHLGSDRVILSRSFAKSIGPGTSVRDEILKINSFLNRDVFNFPELRKELDRRVTLISESKRLLRRI